MKVTRIKTFHVTGENQRSYFIVKVETDAGIYGLGESGALFWGPAIEKAGRAPIRAGRRPGPLRHREALAAHVQGRLLPRRARL